MKKLFAIVLMLVAVGPAKDRTDKAVYETHKNFSGKDKEYLVADLSTIDHPRDIAGYNPLWHTPPIRQDTTNTCWCFCTTSFLESELHRLGRGDIKLSRMFTVYWEYVEKVRRFVQQKGESLVGEGSQPNAVINRMKQYGAVRAEDYTGLLSGQTVHNHRAMHKEITAYLDYVKKNNEWHEEQVIENVRSIMDRHIGRPPEQINVNGMLMTPQEYMKNILQLPLDDYVSVMSFKKPAFWTKGAYDVPDNWWHSEEYYNVPLDDFYAAVKNAVKNGYSLVIAGDVSEPGKYGWKDIGFIPTFDIPSDYINQDAREFRFYNKTSTDDHGMHLIGYKRYKGEDWFLIKDSASSAWKGEFDGYHFFHEDYIKLKILVFLTHKDALHDVLQKFQKNERERILE